MLKLKSGHIIPDVQKIVLEYGTIELNSKGEWLPVKDDKILHPLSTKDLPAYGTIPYAAAVLRQWRNK